MDAARRRGDTGLFYRFRAFTAFFIRPFLDSEIRALPYPEQLRRRLEILGPTYVKLGQILSLRKDLLPDVVTDELRNLLSDLPPVSFDKIRVVIEDDLGHPVEEIFASINEVPLGSASIAQSHRARLRTGEDVILKVVKPGIRELIYRDSTLLRTTARFLQYIIPRYQPKNVIDEFCEYTVREVEMRLEAENAETFAANFADMPDVVFPAIYHDYSGTSVLCMEFLDGVRPDDPAVLDLPLAERQKMIDLGASAIIRMLYQDGYFHADLHPANLLALPGPKVGFIDLGMVGHFDAELRHNLLHLFYSLVMEDFERAARYLAAVSRTDERSDVLGFRTAVKEVARKWRRRATLRGLLARAAHARVRPDWAPATGSTFRWRWSSWSRPSSPTRAWAISSIPTSTSPRCPNATPPGSSASSSPAPGCSTRPSGPRPTSSTPSSRCRCSSPKV